MEQKGLAPRDLIPFVGSRNRVHEVLNRKRPLTLRMVWRLHADFGIPAESLIAPPRRPVARMAQLMGELAGDRADR
jgi:HTH-type transcriptional regulator/antitoxin HigA